MRTWLASAAFQGRRLASGFLKNSWKKSLAVAALLASAQAQHSRNRKRVAKLR